MAYDAHRQRMVLFGGRNNSTSFNDTWEFDGTDWTTIPTGHSPAAQSGLSMTYDWCQPGRWALCVWGHALLRGGERARTASLRSVCCSVV